MPPTAERPTILILDDDEAALQSMRRTLRSHGFDDVAICDDSRKVLDMIDEHPVALLLLDLLIPHRSGEEVLADVKARHPNLPIVVVTAEQAVRPAIRCMKLGAIDYLLKPVNAERLVAVVEKGLEHGALQYECARLRAQFFGEENQDSGPFANIITDDPRMRRLFAYVDAISRGSQPVLIVGETGTGKELVARALHKASRASEPFVGVNAAGLEDSLFDDTLFGHRSGAFTGATRARRGMVEQAGAGTLFLDEIGDLSEASQVKLLRLLQEGEYYPLGSDASVRLRSRVVAATHKDPRELRPDLYYRLRTYRVDLPPLRERLGDLPRLVDHFLGVAARELGKLKPTVPAELFLYLQNYAFPGNVRELQGVVAGAVARHERGVMSVKSFLDQIEVAPVGGEPSTGPATLTFPFPLPTLREIERALVAEALRRMGGNQTAAARMLGVSRPTIGRIQRELGEQPPEAEVSEGS